jgi:hypothetical protein
MLVLPALAEPPITGVTWFGDHAVEQLAYAAPPGIGPATGPDGEPEFLLLRYRTDSAGGGLLRLGMAWTPLTIDDIDAAAAAGWTLQPIPLDAVRARLVRRLPIGGSADAIGPWVAGTIGGGGAAVLHIGMSPHDVELVRQLLEERTDLLDVDVEGTYHGLVEGLPWLVTAPRDALDSVLRATLADRTVTADEVDAAFLSLPQGPDGVLRATPLAVGATPVAPEVLAVEAARRALDVLFDPAGPNDEGANLYRLAPLVPHADPVALDLLPPRQSGGTVAASWSVTALYDTLDDAARDRLFPSVLAVEPFVSLHVPVVCDVPFDPRFLTRLQCDVRHTGATGVPEFTSLRFPEGGAVQTVEVTYPSNVAALDLAFRVQTTLAPPSGAGWPVVDTGEYVAITSPMIEIDRDAAGLDFVFAEADDDVFALAPTVRVTVGTAAALDTAHVDLSAARPKAWVALRGVATTDALTAAVDAVAPDSATPAARLWAEPVAGRRVAVYEPQLNALLAQVVTVTLDPAAAAGFAYVAVTLDAAAGGTTTRTIQPDAPISVSIRRASLFEPARFRYRLDLVPIDDDGQTLPLYSTDWTDAEGTSLVLSPVRPTPDPTP